MRYNNFSMFLLGDIKHKYGDSENKNSKIILYPYNLKLMAF